MIFLVILDILGILFCVYRKFIKKKKDKNVCEISFEQINCLFDDHFIFILFSVFCLWLMVFLSFTEPNI